MLDCLCLIAYVRLPMLAQAVVDAHFMRHALDQTHCAQRQREVPIGAVVGVIEKIQLKK